MFSMGGWFIAHKEGGVFRKEGFDGVCCRIEGVDCCEPGFEEE